MNLLVSIVEQFSHLQVILDSELLLGLAFLMVTAALVGTGMPGVLMPISFSSGALLGGYLSVAVVVLGAVLGSQALFLLGRRSLAERLRLRWGARLKRFDGNIARHGFIYLLGLRLMGVPHLFVTAACALSPIRARSFALATTLGFLPAVTLAAMAGWAV